MSVKLSSILTKLNNKYILSLAGNGIMSGVGMITSIILLRALSIPDMGIWILFLTSFLLLDTIRSGFLTVAFIKFFSGAEEERGDEIIGSTWVIAIAITGFFAVLNIPAYFIGEYIENKGLSLFFNWFGIAFIASLPFFVATCILQAKQRFDQLLILRIFNQGSFVILLFVFIAYDNINVHTVVYSYILSNILSSLIGLIMGWTNLGKIKNVSKIALSDLYHFGKFSVGTALSASLFGTADKFIINFMLGPAALAIYDTGGKLIQVVEIPLRSFIATAMPTLSSYYNKGLREEVLLVMKKYIGMITIMLVPFTLLTFIFADYIILILGGEKYVTSAAPDILRIFMVISLLYPVDRFLALTLDVIHMPKINFYKVLIMLTVTIITDFIGIYITGNVFGVVVATVFPVITGILISFYALNMHYLKFNFIDIYVLGFKELKILLNNSLGLAK
ncbi:MAG: oligosaccharide flippase family protein [Daejeonella sp.]|uniref:oligosaccharide flippase family protein n=1 Tax=Daejeonella sp. TaxID=2805397 RepID=UPI003C73FFF5